MTGTLPESRARVDNLMLGLIIAWSTLALAMSVLRGARHDYVAYLRQWLLVAKGEDPWGEGNTYGPLHVALAYLAELGPLIPKLFMVVAFLATNFLLAAALLKSRPQTSSLVAYLIFVPLNFLVISIVISFGLNDALAAALVGLAVLARFRGRLVVAGVLLVWQYCLSSIQHSCCRSSASTAASSIVSYS
jgi:fumarate reductase subunit D